MGLHQLAVQHPGPVGRDVRLLGIRPRSWNLGQWCVHKVEGVFGIPMQISCTVGCWIHLSESLPEGITDSVLRRLVTLFVP